MNFVRKETRIFGRWWQVLRSDSLTETLEVEEKHLPATVTAALCLSPSLSVALSLCLSVSLSLSVSLCLSLSLCLSVSVSLSLFLSLLFSSLSIAFSHSIIGDLTVITWTYLFT